jgi:hypothetical protein
VSKRGARAPSKGGSVAATRARDGALLASIRRRARLAQDDTQNGPLDSIVNAMSWCPYGALGLARGASLDDVKRAFKAKALEIHPDRAQHLPPSEQASAAQQFRVESFLCGLGGTRPGAARWARR